MIQLTATQEAQCKVLAEAEHARQLEATEEGSELGSAERRAAQSEDS